MKGARIPAKEFIDNMLRAGCVFDPTDPRKLMIPDHLAEIAGVTPGYFYINDPVDGVAIVEKFTPDGIREYLQ